MSGARLYAAIVLCIYSLSVESIARQIPLTILFTSDINGSLYESNHASGLLKCASVIQKVRQTSSNILLLDCGDAYHGSFVSSLSKGGIIQRAMNYLEYDACVPGKHDFDWGLEAYRNILQIAEFPILAANVEIDSGNTGGLSNPLVPFIVKGIDGITVAVIGLACPIIPLCHLPGQLTGLRFMDPVTALRGTMPLVREHEPDIILLITHQGWREYDNAANRINEIARCFPEIDIILGGQTHKIIDKQLSDKVWYAQAGSRGSHLGVVVLNYNNVSREIDTIEIVTEPVPNDLEPDKGLGEYLKSALSRAEDTGRERVGYLERPVAGSQKKAKPSTSGLISKAIREATEAAVVLLEPPPKLSRLAGHVTRADIWDRVPQDFEIVLFKANPAMLDMILEENEGQSAKYAKLSVHGISYDHAKSQEKGSRISNIKFEDGSNIHPRRLLLVAAADYTMASSQGKRPFLRSIAAQPSTRLEMTGIDIREAVIDYVHYNYPLGRDE